MVVKDSLPPSRFGCENVGAGYGVADLEAELRSLQAQLAQALEANGNSTTVSAQLQNALVKLGEGD